MSYFVCENCGGYYKLQEGESPEVYSDTCECGGKLQYFEYIPLLKIYKNCPRCGFEGHPPIDNTRRGCLGFNFRPLRVWCPKCHYYIIRKNTCPICGFEGKLLSQKHEESEAVYACPSCENSFGILEEEILEDEVIKKNKFYYFRLIRLVASLIVTLIFGLLLIKDYFPL